MSYDRRYNIYLDDKLFIEGGAGRQLRITFSLSSGFGGANGRGDLAIFNLGPDSAPKIKSGSVIKVEAGYVDNIGVIYSGMVGTVLRERVGVDIAVRALMNGWTKQDKNWSHTFPVNSSLLHIVRTAAQVAGYALSINPGSFEKYSPYTSGYTVANRNPTRVLQDLAEEHSFGLAIERDRIVINVEDEDQGVTPYEINEFTGMELLPEVTNEGVDVVTRMNPTLSLGMPFEVTSKYASYTMANVYNDQSDYRGYELGRGVHIIKELEYQGDSWGSNWSTAIVGRRKR